VNRPLLASSHPSGVPWASRLSGQPKAPARGGPAADGEPTPGGGEVALAALGAGVMATHLTLDPGYLQPGHSHAEHESIGFVLSGRIRMVVDDAEAILEAGDAWWHPRGRHHVTEALAPSTAIEIHTPLRPDVLERLGLA
jgi:quercetin dioxygenase-like cupin family protein